LNARLTGMTKQKRVRMYHQALTSINRIVAASRDTTTKVWDAQTGQELVTLTGHDSRCIESEWKRITTSCRCRPNLHHRHGRTAANSRKPSYPSTDSRGKREVWGIGLV